MSMGQDPDSKKQFSLRLCSLIMLILLVIIAAGIAGSLLISPAQQTQHKQYIAQLQYEQRNLTHKLSETEAQLALRDAQLESMQAELLRNEHDMHAMKKRLAMFDDVLAARKVGGWHILHPTAQWLDEHNIVYSLVVVKGENYPRWAKGHISFSVIDSSGKTIALDNKAGKRSLQFDVTTHKFFEGRIPWARAWQAKMLIVSLFDKRGKNNQHIEIPIVSRAAIKPAKRSSTTANQTQLEHKALKISPRIPDALSPQREGEP